MPYPKRLIEVDLPIRRISEIARYEKKSAGYGHLNTLHIWWSRKPLGVCRAVAAASLWPDPCDNNCPEKFITEAKLILLEIADNFLHLLSQQSFKRFNKYRENRKLLDKKLELQKALLDFIADLTNTEKCNNPELPLIAQRITKVATETMHPNLGGQPVVLDPFSGGGSFPLEATRVGASSIGSDLSPVAIMINKVLLEYLPTADENLALIVDKFGKQILRETEEELKNLYPSFSDGSTPVAYLFARAVICEGPSCGAKVPMITSLWLQKKGKTKVALKIVPDIENKVVGFEIITNPKKVEGFTAKRGNVICPCCGFTTSVDSVRKQFTNSNGGTTNAQMIAAVYSKENQNGRIFRLPSELELKSINLASKLVKKKEESYIKDGLEIPLNVELPLMSGVFNAPIYGINTWRKLYSDRQYLVLLTLAEKIALLENNPELSKLKGNTKQAVITCLGLVQSKLADLANALCTWEPNVPTVQHLYGRQAIGMSWNFAEGNIFGSSRGSWNLVLSSIVKVIEANSKKWNSATVEISNASNHFLPDDSVQVILTDPPYYNAIPYADLSELFYLWQKITLGNIHKKTFISQSSPKDDEICEMAGWDGRRYSHKNKEWFENQMTIAMQEARRILTPDGLAVVVFAHKTTSGWEAMLQAILNAGWVVTASWPIDTELGSRLRGMDSAVLASSVHLVCRPRENEDGSLIHNQIGDWRDVQQELPKRIHEWMPRLAAEGVAGADAIFACLGPALEVFSRYSSVEKPNGDVVTLREYLEKVWAAVSQEALNMVFTGGEAQGLEEDARLTAMWLWTLTAGASDNGVDAEDDDSDEEESSTGGKLTGGFTLEYDTARKIAQGLGANLEDLKTLVEVKGDKARLLPVIERTSKLFGSAGIQQQPVKKKKKVQLTLSFENVEPEAESKFQMPELKVEQTGKTVLDRLHQAMLLFSTGRTEALKRFLVEDGAGKDDRFWKLAQSLTSLYPKDTDERRWVEAVQTYKKSLGF
jgi:adenine-specific DNA methylase